MFIKNTISPLSKCYSQKLGCSCLTFPRLDTSLTSVTIFALSGKVEIAQINRSGRNFNNSSPFRPKVRQLTHEWRRITNQARKELPLLHLFFRLIGKPLSFYRYVLDCLCMARGSTTNNNKKKTF